MEYNLTLTQDEKDIVLATLKDFARLQIADIDRAGKDPEWAKKWEWVLHITKRNMETAQKIIDRLENQNK